MTLGYAEIPIPSEIVSKWQRLVDLLANIVCVPSAVVCKLEAPDYAEYKILTCNSGDENPFAVDDRFSMDIGTFCETVIKTRHPLLVINALEDNNWKLAPEIKFGMISYLGLPVAWPDGQMFGTICVLDVRANEYNDLYHDLLLLCRDVLQSDLKTLVTLTDEIEDQRAELRELFARVPEAVVMLDRHYRIVRINYEFTRIFGYTAEEATHRRLIDIITPDELKEESRRLLDQLFNGGDAFAVETVRARKDGTRLPVSIVCVPVPSHDPDRLGYLIYRDITDRKRLEFEQRRFHEIELELADVNRVATLAQLSASIAHELNQPLTGIITNCGTCLQILANDDADLGGVRDAVRRTLRDSERASEVVKRLRALFANKPLAFEDVDINEAAREVLALSLVDFEASGVTLRTEFADDLPMITADRVQLQQVILNLLRNGLDAMCTVGERSRDLLIKTELEDHSVRLSVTDAGVGFPSETANKLFDPFYSTKEGGMGVGLAVCRSIIESHHGRIRASLNDSHGATFGFSIPVADPTRPAQAHEAVRT